MRKVAVFSFLSIVFHLVFLWVIPISLLKANAPEERMVMFWPVERKGPSGSSADTQKISAGQKQENRPAQREAAKPAPAARPAPQIAASAPPPPQPPKPSASAKPDTAARGDVAPPPVAEKKEAAASEQGSGAEKQAEEETYGETAAPGDVAAESAAEGNGASELPEGSVTVAAAVPAEPASGGAGTGGEENAPAEAGEGVAEEEHDGRVELPVVQTFVGDRLQGRIEFQGKGRKLAFVPPAPNFQLSGNTVVSMSFKIDKYGNTYDIDIPPISRDVEYLLRDFVSKMRFSAVLYDEADLASMKVNLRVR